MQRLCLRKELTAIAMFEKHQTINNSSKLNSGKAISASQSYTSIHSQIFLSFEPQIANRGPPVLPRYLAGTFRGLGSLPGCKRAPHWWCSRYRVAMSVILEVMAEPPAKRCTDSSPINLGNACTSHFVWSPSGVITPLPVSAPLYAR